jgi:nucleoside-diphosphate-sugar epimerase
MSVIGMTPEQFPSVPLKDSPGRKLGFAVKSSLTKRMKYLMDKYQSLKGTSPKRAKWMYKAPRKALRLTLRPITKRLPDMDPVSRAIYNQKTVIDVSKNRELLGFKPRYSVEEGMKITCDWLRWSDLFKPKA